MRHLLDTVSQVMTGDGVDCVRGTQTEPIAGTSGDSYL